MTSISQHFVCTPENDEIETLERLERLAGFIKRAAPYNRYFGDFSDEEMCKNAEKIVKGNTGWYADYAKLYLEHYQELPVLRKEIRLRTEKL